MKSLACPLAAASAVLACSLAAQTPGEFNTFGVGCNNIAVSQNDPIPGFTPRSLPNEYAHAVILPSGGTVAAVSFYFETVSGGAETIQAGIYMDAGAGTPAATAMATTWMDVAGPLGWYTATFDTPVPVPANTLFFVSADTNAVRPPDAGPSGATPAAPSYWRRPPFGGGGWSPTGIIDSPIWRVHVLGPTGGVRTLTSAGVPQVNNTLDVTLRGAANGSAALFGLGLSNTNFNGLALPFDLTAIRMPGCSLFISLDATAQNAITMNNEVTQTYTVPNTPSLVGAQLFMQGIAVDGSTPRGLAMTNAARLVIGS